MKEKWRFLMERDLRAIPPVTVKKSWGATVLLVGGQEWLPVGVKAEAVADEITFARSRVIPPDEPAMPAQSAGSHERTMVIKEVVKVRCPYCGVLNLESDAKCSSCGAPLGR
ncbi:MAG: zinc ribbon domain-containing protein [Nitrososphaerota archaeon]|nr:zinc ribbon domain-containing protein [Nitrososphaerota archaeon]